MAVRNLTHGSMVLSDGTTPTPVTLTVPIQSGDLAFARKKEAHTILNRGSLKEFSQGMETPCDISFTAIFERWQGKPAGTPTVKDFLTGTGLSVANKTKSANKLNSPFTCDIIFTIKDVEGGPSLGGTGYNEILTFTEFVADEISFKEGEDANTISVKGKALLLEPAVTSVASS